MGRQIQLHLLGNDINILIEHIGSKRDLRVLLRDSDSDDLESVDDILSERRIMALWNRALLPNLQRRTIICNDGSPRHFVDGGLPVLELAPSFESTWNGRPGLIQGRIYGEAVGGDEEFARWYESIVRWIRKEFRKNPFSFGYVGPEAWNWYERGGVLLPFFVPPVTPAWVAEIARQHSARK